MVQLRVSTQPSITRYVWYPLDGVTPPTRTCCYRSTCINLGGGTNVNQITAATNTSSLYLGPSIKDVIPAFQEVNEGFAAPVLRDSICKG
jgi:hypothetical protein